MQFRQLGLISIKESQRKHQKKPEREREAQKKRKEKKCRVGNEGEKTIVNDRTIKTVVTFEMTFL